jgi:hypothetical protein
MKQNLKYIIPLLIIATIGITITPILNLKEVLAKNLNSNSKQNFFKSSEFILLSYNPIEPVMAVIRNSGDDELMRKEAGFYIITFQREGLFNYRIKKEYEGATKNYTINQLKDLFKNDNVLRTNPDPNNLQIPCIPNYCTPPPRLSDEEYKSKQDQTFLNKTYFGVKNKSGKPRSIDEFKKLKVGMNMEKDIELKIGFGDLKGTEELNYTKGPEYLYDIDGTKGVNLIILSVEFIAQDSIDFYKENLKAMYIVYDDKRIEEYKLEK